MEEIVKDRLNYLKEIKGLGWFTKEDLYKRNLEIDLLSMLLNLWENEKRRRHG